MSTASFNTRLKRIQSVEDSLSLEQWKAKFIRNRVAVPRHVLVSIAAGRMVPRHVADALERHPAYRAWLAFLRDTGGADENFEQFCLQQGTTIDRVLSGARKARSTER